MNSAEKGFKFFPLFYIMLIVYGRVFYFIMVIIAGIFKCMAIPFEPRI